MNELHEVNIRGVPVSFPFEPYDVQIDYMASTLQAIQQEQYALLESPTGTGKTLSLLCSALSWREETNSSAQILYSTRTHSQLSNVVKELKKTRFRPRVAHIASRKILCINQNINKYDNYIITRLCHNLRSNKTCPYGVEEVVNKVANDVLLPRIDLEEYVKMCQSKNVCPYYAAQINSQKADLILAPYSYIVDPNVRNFLPVGAITGNILIFDEAHNFADQCSDNMSIDFSFAAINNAYNTLSRINPQKFQVAMLRMTNKVTLNDLVATMGILNGLRSYFNSLEETSPEYAEIIAKSERKEGQVFYLKKSVSELYEVLTSVGIYDENVGMLKVLLDNVMSKGVELDLLMNEYGNLYLVQKFLQLLYPENHKDVKTFNTNYAVCYTSDRNVSIICFSPHIGFHKLAAFLPKTIILTSGTLSPLESLEQELMQKFPIKLECNHIIDPEQVMLAICNNGPSSVNLNFSFSNRKGNSKRLKQELIDSLSNIFATTPSGSLVFFPSYSYLGETSLDIKTNTQKYKRIYIESRHSNQNDSILSGYQRDANKGAALLAVCRGKMSEGLDFADDYARCVIVVGIPFPNVTDYKVELKKQWLNARSPGSGDRWYIECALQAVNQSIGRAIRHKDDYAVIILMDERYQSYKYMLSHWLQNSIHTYDDFSTMSNEINYFFRLRTDGVFPQRLGRRVTTFVSRNSSSASQDFSTDEISENTNSSEPKKVKEFVPPTIVQLKKKETKHHKSKPSIDLLSTLLGSQKNSSREQSSSQLSSSSSTELLANFITLKKKPKSSSTQSSQVMSLPKKGENQKNKETNTQEMFCVVCKTKDKLVKMKCNHYICEKCKSFFMAVKMPCPLCKAKK